MALDVNDSYKQSADKIKSIKSYKDAKEKYDSVTKKAGDSFEKAKSAAATGLNELNNKKQAFERQLKSQFEQLLDISSLVGGGSDSSSLRYLKNTFIKVLRRIRPEIEKILLEEVINTLGCDQQQTYTGEQELYIKVSSVDLSKSLLLDPATKAGKFYYEKDKVSIQTRPFSMNRELYNRVQSGLPYSVDNGQLYLGASGQPLFDIQYVDVNPNNGVPGGWFKITLKNRINNENKVIQFLADYYKSIRVIEFPSIIANIIDSICGAISFDASFGIDQVSDASTFSLYIQRILGLCFDSTKEIDVSGISKLDNLENIDESFFELSSLDLRLIEEKTNNFVNGIIQFKDCDNVILPIDSNQILDALGDLYLVTGSTQIEAVANQITNSISNNPDWGGYQFNASIDASLDLDFIKLMCEGIIKALLSPKILLPIITMLKAIQGSISSTLYDGIASFKLFCKNFKKLIVNLISKIGAIFVRELFDMIKKDLFNLIQSVIKDLAKESASTQIIIILKLTQLLIVTAQFISDWRRCKSVVDELLKLLTIATTGFGLQIPSPLLLISQLLSGYSATRAFIGSIEEMQKLGIPTGSMPDGSPNLDLLSKFGQMKAQGKEQAENGKVMVATNPGRVFPNGTTSGAKGFGKSM